MKYPKPIIVMIMAILTFAFAYNLCLIFPSKEAVAVLPEAATCLYTFDDLLDAIAVVESNNNPNAIGDNGNAIGKYQIWKIYVDDVNRIQSEHVYSYSDRTDPDKSRAIVSAYLRYYGGTLEGMARKHNGGPTGHTKQATIKYWEKIEKELRSEGE